MIEVSRGRPLYNKIYKYRWQYLMILPGVVLLFLFSYIPMAGIQVAFKDFQIGTSIWDSTWAGWDNFSFLEDLQFLTVVQNTLYISVLKFICGFPAPILLALLINEVTRPAFKRFVQSVSYLPHFFSWIVVAYILQSFLTLDGGLVNQFIGQAGENRYSSSVRRSGSVQLLSSAAYGKRPAGTPSSIWLLLQPLIPSCMNRRRWKVQASWHRSATSPFPESCRPSPLC